MVFMDVVYLFGVIGIDNVYGKYAQWPALAGVCSVMAILPSG